MQFELHTPETAPEAARSALREAEKMFGFVPNLLRLMAEAPSALQGYLELTRLFQATSLTPHQQQVVILAVSRTNGCDYCLAAHKASAKMAGVPKLVVEALIADQPLPDNELEELRRFTRRVVATLGHPTADDIRRFLEAGYTKANILEVILGVSMKTLSNYTNHIAETPVDRELTGTED